ncbi:MAG: hypothetical protein CL609_04005 [Anaerolineaceae bacterium]|nr:hypothetical protein [Anaerolineaceae bacterium]
MTNHKNADLFSEKLDQIIHNQSTGKANNDPDLDKLLETSEWINQIMMPTESEKQVLKTRFDQFRNKLTPSDFKRPQNHVRFFQVAQFIGIILFMVGAAALIFRLFQDFLPLTPHSTSQPAGIPTELPAQTVYQFTNNEFIVSIDFYHEAISKNPAAGGYGIYLMDDKGKTDQQIYYRRNEQTVLQAVSPDGRLGLLISTPLDHFFGEKILKLYNFTTREVVAEYTQYIREARWIDNKSFVFIQQVDGIERLMLFDLEMNQTKPLSPVGMNVLRYVGEMENGYLWQAGTVFSTINGISELDVQGYWYSTLNEEPTPIWETLSGQWVELNPKQPQAVSRPDECVVEQTVEPLPGCDQLTFRDLDGKPTGSMQLAGGIKKVYWSPNGESLLAAVRLTNMDSPGDRVVWLTSDQKTNQLLPVETRLMSRPTEMELEKKPVWSPDGKQVILWNETIDFPVIWTFESRKVTDLPQTRSYFQNMYSIFWNPNHDQKFQGEWVTGDFNVNQTTTVNQIPVTITHIKLTDTAVKFTLCFEKPADPFIYSGNQVFLHYRGNDLFLNQIRSDQIDNSAQNQVCSEYLAVRPSDWGLENYQLIVERLVASTAWYGPENDCKAFKEKLKANEGIEINCDFSTPGVMAVDVLDKPEDMTDFFANQIIYYYEHIVLEGPWRFDFAAGVR